MSSASAISSFLGLRSIAVLGVSRTGKRFGAMAFRHLKSEGYNVYPVNPGGGTIDGVELAPSLQQLSGKVEGALFVIPPAQSLNALKDAREAGIRQIWFQTGSESQEALQYCQQSGMTAIHGECIMMFANPRQWGHKAHRWIRKVTGKLPQ